MARCTVLRDTASVIVASTLVVLSQQLEVAFCLTYKKASSLDNHFFVPLALHQSLHRLGLDRSHTFYIELSDLTDANHFLEDVFLHHVGVILP